MKKSFISAIALLIVITTSCTVNNGTANLTEDPQARQEVFETILNDSRLLSDFTDQMMQNPNAMHQMMMNTQLMQQMFSEENMQMMQDMVPQTMLMMMDNMLQTASTDSSIQNMMMNNQHMQNMMQNQQTGSMMQ